jgi:hypothetical protein
VSSARARASERARGRRLGHLDAVHGGDARLPRRVEACEEAAKPRKLGLELLGPAHVDGGLRHQ